MLATNGRVGVFRARACVAHTVAAPMSPPRRTAVCRPLCTIPDIFCDLHANYHGSRPAVRRHLYAYTQAVADRMGENCFSCNSASLRKAQAGVANVRSKLYQVLKRSY